MLSMWFKVGTQGKKSQQYVMVTASSLRCLQVWWLVGEFLGKSLSLQQNFVAATSFKKSNQTEFV